MDSMSPTTTEIKSWQTIIRAFLEEYGRTQADLARASNTNEAHLSKCLKGERHPGPRTLRKLEKGMERLTYGSKGFEGALTQLEMDLPDEYTRETAL